MRVPFALNVQFSKTDMKTVVGRLEAHLMKIMNIVDDDDIPYRARLKVKQRAETYMRKHNANSGINHLKPELQVRIQSMSGGVKLAGPRTEHDADVIAARLVDELPWMIPVIDIIWQDMRESANEGRGLAFRPILMSGPPGIGKTHLASVLANLCNTPAVTVDAGQGSEGFRLAGVDRTWSTASPGRVVDTILNTGIGNPVIFVDEIDKAGISGIESNSGAITSIYNALLGLLEPVSAQRWECPFFGVRFDMSHVSYLLAANDPRRIPEPLLTRLHHVKLGHMKHQDLLYIAKRFCEQGNHDFSIVDDIDKVISLYPVGHKSLNLRTTMRMLKDIVQLTKAPVFH